MIVRCDATMWGRKRRRADTRESFHSSLQRVESGRKHKEKERVRRTRVNYYYCIESAPRRLQSISPSTQTVDVRFGRPLGRDSLPRNSSAVPGGVLYSTSQQQKHHTVLYYYSGAHGWVRCRTISQSRFATFAAWSFRSGFGSGSARTEES